MEFDDDQTSENIEDRRGMGGGRGFAVGGIGTVIIALAASYFLGIDPGVVLNALTGMQQSVPQQQGPAPAPPQDDPQAKFIGQVLRDTEDTWQAVFARSGQQYVEPRLVLFSGVTPTACGTGQSAMGPFYCPEDQKVYIDLSFYRELQQRFHAPGEFAQAYVIGHEVGHHVQNLLGISAKVDAARQRLSGPQFNKVSVRMELQADCFAGVWAHNSRHIRLEESDIESALNAASQIGDDAIQRQTQGRVVPDAFTHGTSEQRVRWFKRGWEDGDIRRCDTFDAAQL
jgi:predicted metalloprotease